MAVVKGVRERVHFPLYDAREFRQQDDVSGMTNGNTANIADQIRATGNVIKFFVNVQGKTKLETNQQESSVLSHYNTYEVRALRVIIQPPHKVPAEPPTSTGEKAKTHAKTYPIPSHHDHQVDTVFLSDFIYNSVTTLIVGEKVMIQAPTWFFPSGAGPSNEQGLTNGWPSPEATFRLAEPVTISHQQNFRVEIEFPRGVDVFMDVNGPAKIWVVLDGYITRDVQ